jgi:hypothetical protein
MSRFVILALVLALLSGCGPARPKKVLVSGTVTMDGKPLQRGEIYFTVPEGGTAPDVLQVADGKFEGKVTVGKKRVEISSPQPVPTRPGAVQMGPPEVLNLVHEDYNINSKLTAEVSEGSLDPSHFEVKSNRSAR